MANAITVLLQKREALIRHKQEFKREYERNIQAVDAEIQHIDNALSAIAKVAEAYHCKFCNGTGVVYGADAAGSREERVCSRCHGTGFDVSEEGL
jgi:DnaJ-class molecular chaperone